MCVFEEPALLCFCWFVLHPAPHCCTASAEKQGHKLHSPKWPALPKHPNSPCITESQNGGSSLSLASTKVCSSMDDGDGAGNEAEAMEEQPQVPASIAERYKVGRTIGDGNFAVVRECVERSTGREYALKIINKGKCRGKEHMIQNEVSILRRVKHPNIVLLIEEMDTYSELYLVMELVKGGDLFDAITSTNKYTERDASGMLYNLTNAIKYLHSLNIVHRDIKPENLLWWRDSPDCGQPVALVLGSTADCETMDGSAAHISECLINRALYPRPSGVYEHQDGSKSLKLGDFGLATVVDGPLYTVCGTPTYVAPEIIAETGAFECLCPVSQLLTPGLFFLCRYGLKELITSMLQVEVDQRYNALQVLEHPWVNDDGLSENEHQLSVAGKIKKHFNTGPKPDSSTAGVSVISGGATMHCLSLAHLSELKGFELDQDFTIQRSGKQKNSPPPPSPPLSLCLDETTALDKERQVLGRRRHQDVRPAPWTPHVRLPADTPGPSTTASGSEDFSPSSSETIRSLNSPNSPF
ncbi:hypothetical protein JZ751_023044 [Albula glossodonta]|uniref:Protein kinase domain-containing protein n=1 Tax=Albula glossodonta TaxID=121402 RepID=A0A8T2PEL8_9TELE|nr:hypothetical protein JZ751_023044 [Albula glossodonta]